MKQLDTSFSHKYNFTGGLYVRLTRLIYTDNDRHFEMELGPEHATEDEFERLFYGKEFERAIKHFNEEYEKFLRKHHPERFGLVQS